VSVTYTFSEADRVFRQCRRQFVATFAESLAALRANGALLHRGTQFVWSCRGRRGFTTIFSRDRPTVDDLSRPLIPSVWIGGPPSGRQAAVYRTVGQGLESPGEPANRRPMPAASFMGMPDEVISLAPWLAEWTVCRVASRRRLPPPPVPFRWDGDLRRLRVGAEVWTHRAHAAHWRWFGPIAVREALGRKVSLGLAFEEGFELSLCQCEAEPERQDIRNIYSDWLAEHGHDFESRCFRAGCDPADVLVGDGVAWGLHRGPFTTHHAFRLAALQFPLLDPSGCPAPDLSYRSASEAKVDFLAAWGVCAGTAR